jgi:hypothetical protein
VSDNTASGRHPGQDKEEREATEDWQDAKKRPADQAFEDPKKTKEWEDDK